MAFRAPAAPIDTPMPAPPPPLAATDTAPVTAMIPDELLASRSTIPSALSTVVTTLSAIKALVLVSTVLVEKAPAPAIRTLAPPANPADTEAATVAALIVA